MQRNVNFVRSKIYSEFSIVYLIQSAFTFQKVAVLLTVYVSEYS